MFNNIFFFSFPEITSGNELTATANRNQSSKYRIDAQEFLLVFILFSFRLLNYALVSPTVRQLFILI
jgi:hypothetical protein